MKMRVSIAFQLPSAPPARQRVEERLAEVLELVNLEQEEQAIDPEVFKGNLEDYPDWFRSAFQDRGLLQALAEYCGCEVAELEEWDFEGWYDDFFAAPTFRFACLQEGSAQERRLVFEVLDPSWEGFASQAWLVLACGGVELIPAKKTAEGAGA